MSYNEAYFDHCTKETEKMIKSGKDIYEALAYIKKDFSLTESEIDVISSRLKKKPVVEDDVEIGISQSEPVSNTISFTSGKELDDAIGILMYKGIPWLTKNTNSVTFGTPEEVTHARDVLKRRWDFVNSNKKTVAVLEFDNLSDYKKVCDFLSQKNLLVVRGSSNELDEEIIETEDTPIQSMSFDAVHRENMLDPNKLNTEDDKSNRVLRVIKRWK